MVGLETVNENKGDAATKSGCKFYENMRMQCDDECNKQINTHNDNEKNMEAVWSVGLGALQHSTTIRGSRPEI